MNCRVPGALLLRSVMVQLVPGVAVFSARAAAAGATPAGSRTR